MINPQNKQTEQNNSIPTSKHKKEDSPNFLLKLYNILETPAYKDIIRWSDNGKYFIVLNLHDFTENILPKFYKHNNYSSFVRQLNMYDFHKKRSRQNEHIFIHKCFCRDKRELIHSIKRKNKKDFPLLTNKEGTKNEVALMQYFNSDIKKKVTKRSLERALSYLANTVNESIERQRGLERKVDDLGRQNESFFIQNQQMLREIMEKTESNQRLEAVVYFIIDFILKNKGIKNSELKNFLLSKGMGFDFAVNSLPKGEVNEISNNNINVNGNSNINRNSNGSLSDMQRIIQFHLPKKVQCEMEDVDNELFKAFLDKYVERKNGGNCNCNFIARKKQSDIKKNALPLLGCGSEGGGDELSVNNSIRESPRIFNNRKPSIDTINSCNINDDLFKNTAMKQITNNEDLVLKDNGEKKDESKLISNIEGENMMNNSIPSQNNLFNIDFNSSIHPDMNNMSNMSFQSDKKFSDKCFFE